MSKKKITSPKEYLKGQRKQITLPSGAVFEIRKLSPIAFGEVLKIMGPETARDMDDIVRDKIVDIMKVIVPRCVVKPKITLEETDDKDKLSLEDLEMQDVFALLDEVYAFSGLSTEDVEEKKSFPKDSPSTTSS